MSKMIDIRCPICDRLLAKTDGNLEIKCPKAGCRAIVRYNKETGEIKAYKEPARDTSSGKRFY
jgi:phage FluMu protein Com